MTDWLKHHNSASKVFDDAADELHLLSRAMETVGNSIMASKLRGLAYRIEGANLESKSAISDMLTYELKESQRAVGDTFKTLLEAKDGK